MVLMAECVCVCMNVCMYVRIFLFIFYLFIDIQHAPLQSNTTCFTVKYSQYSYTYLHLCTIYCIFYSYGRFTFGFLI